MADRDHPALQESLKLRASVLTEVRRFFAELEVMEVETPLLGTSAVTDVHLQSFEVRTHDPSQLPLFLQTSPEYAMKRLLAAGSGPIYQIAKAFRSGERSRLHNPEFTLIEWYRPGFSLADLMDEVEQFVMRLLSRQKIPRYRYRELFRKHLNLDPHTITLQELQCLSDELMDVCGADLDTTDYLQLLMDQKIEPRLPASCFVYEYPEAQAALSVVAPDAAGVPVAQRFELYVDGMELANGYFELTDAAEQRARFDGDLARRRQLGLPLVPVDEELLAALEAGLPSCAGVALGLDRLLMVLGQNRDICDVISY
ncbi:MAG: EF-P lysine aminoacylase EpmA, partial [Gammaproteobacteria bacterium]|nr:EF-P lysine aminoacylase EpmA [Gammaproteobacteria bacterium]